MSELTNTANPIPYPVRPMSFGEILDRIFQLLRRNFWLLIGVAGALSAAVVAMYALLMGAMFATIGLHPQDPPNPVVMLSVMAPVYLISIVLMLIVYPLYSAAGSYAATSAAEGRKVTVREAYRVAWKHAGRYIWLYFLRVLYLVVPMMIAAAVAGGGFFLISREEGTSVGGILLVVLGVLGYLGALIFGIVMMVRWALSYPACVTEGLKASAALKRSSQLTTGARWRIVGIAAVIYAFFMVAEIASMIAFEVIGVVGALIGVAMHISLQSPAGYIAAGLFAACGLVGLFFLMAILWASYSVSFAVIYLDQRVRLEGYDIERMMQAAGMSQSPDAGEPA
jgi:uncharacterized membrane protein